MKMRRLTSLIGHNLRASWLRALLAMVGIISAETAADLGILICFIGLVAWGIVVARAAKLSRRASILAVGVNVGLGLLLVLLKAILH
jgi:hypothetical protein